MFEVLGEGGEDVLEDIEFGEEVEDVEGEPAGIEGYGEDGDEEEDEDLEGVGVLGVGEFKQGEVVLEDTVFEAGVLEWVVVLLSVAVHPTEGERGSKESPHDEVGEGEEELN